MYTPCQMLATSSFSGSGAHHWVKASTLGVVPVSSLPQAQHLLTVFDVMVTVGGSLSEPLEFVTVGDLLAAFCHVTKMHGPTNSRSALVTSRDQAFTPRGRSDRHDTATPPRAMNHVRQAT